jgi:hypothetical protein
MLKCPNPSCPYVFDPSQVPVGVVLSCPRCAMQFTLGPPQPPTPGPPGPGYAAPPGYPAGYPAAGAGSPAPPPPAFEPEFEDMGRSAVEERDPDEALPPRGTGKAQVFILAGIAAVLMAGTGLAIAFKLMHRGGGGERTDAVTRFNDQNVGIDPPPAGWTQDDNMRVKVGSPFAISFRRENPEAYVAFGFTEADKGRSPRPKEMADKLRSPFPKLFVTGREDNTLRKFPPVASSWLGEPIAPAEAEPFPNGFKFRAQSTEGLIWVGEAYAVAHKGVAYYWMGWCLESDYDAVKDQFAAFRDKFKLLGNRKDWKQTLASVADFKGDKVPYTISDADEIWKEISVREFNALKESEPDLDKRLQIDATPKRDRKAIPDKAELSVFVLDGDGDPLAVARKYAEGREKARDKAGEDPANPYTLTFEELTDAEQGDPVPQPAPATAPAVRLKSAVKESASASRLIVVSAARVGNKVVVVQCSCEYAKRSVFEARFVQIAKSLR